MKRTCRMVFSPLKKARWGKDGGSGGKETPLCASQGGFLPPRKTDPLLTAPGEGEGTGLRKGEKPFILHGRGKDRPCLSGDGGAVFF